MPRLKKIMQECNLGCACLRRLRFCGVGNNRVRKQLANEIKIVLKAFYIIYRFGLLEHEKTIKTTSKEINCVGIKTICEGCYMLEKRGKTQIVKY